MEPDDVSRRERCAIRSVEATKVPLDGLKQSVRDGGDLGMLTGSDHASARARVQARGVVGKSDDRRMSSVGGDVDDEAGYVRMGRGRAHDPVRGV